MGRAPDVGAFERPGRPDADKVVGLELPKEVTLEVDKTGQKLMFRSSDKEMLGQVCSKVRALRPPEPYKGTGIKLESETIARKAGKTKAA